MHDDERPRSAGRGQSARPPVRRPTRRISAGSATPPSSSSASSGKLYLAAILDLFSRFVVGWAVSAVNDRHLTMKALEMAAETAVPRGGLLHHSDQGCTVRERGLSGAPRGARDHVQHEPARQLLRQRRDGELLLVAEDQLPRSRSRAAAQRRWRCSTTSRCSITSAAAFDPRARSVRPNSKARDTARVSRGKPPRTRFPTGSTRIIFFPERRTKNERRSTYGNCPLNRISPRRRQTDARP